MTKVAALALVLALAGALSGCGGEARAEPVRPAANPVVNTVDQAMPQAVVPRRGPSRYQPGAQEFLTAVRLMGVGGAFHDPQLTTLSNAQLLGFADWMCYSVEYGYTVQQSIDAVVAARQVDRESATVLLTSGVHYFCPEFESR